MNILAFVKYSFDVAEIKVDPATKELRTAGAPRRIGNIDKNVVEAAVQLKEQAGGGTVYAISYGPAEAKDSFRDVLAMGADEVVLIEDPLAGVSEPALTVKVLEAAARKLGFDVLVLGETSDDGYSYEVGPRLAERLDVSQVSYVAQMSLAGGQLTADRDLGDTLQVVTAPLPVLITVTEETNKPRRTTLMDAMKAKKKPVHLWQVEADLGLSVEELRQSVRRQQVAVEGIVVNRKQNILKGQDMAVLADQVIDALIAESLLKEGA